MRKALGPGSPATGFLIAACFALLAHFRVVDIQAAIWDDAVFLFQDTRLRDLSSVFTAFGDTFFGTLWQNEMYRPVVNASFAFDWWISGSTPDAPALGWFHLVNLLLHAANAGLVYLFLANCTGRKLGAPILAACLFAVHPLAVEPTAWLVGRGDLFATLFGLVAGILLLRSPGNMKLLVPAVLCYALSLFAKASAATIPALVALAVVAYRGLPPLKLLSKRLAPRFLVFVVPALIWLVVRWHVLGGYPFPDEGGLRWHENVPLGDRALGVGRAMAVLTAKIFVPVRLCGDYSADVAFDPHAADVVPLGIVGIVFLLACAGFGAWRLRSSPRVAFPLLAYVICLLPVLQIVPIGAVLAERFVYLPMIFPLLLVGEGLERAFERVRSPAVLATTFSIFLLLGVQSHARAGVWRSPEAFHRDVLVSYPDARIATHWLAKHLSDTDRSDEAIDLLHRLAKKIERPDDELSLLGAILLERKDYEAAEPILRRAIHEAGGKERIGAQARVNLAVVLKNTGRADEAIRMLEESLRRRPIPEARELLERLRAQRAPPPPEVPDSDQSGSTGPEETGSAAPELWQENPLVADLDLIFDRAGPFEIAVQLRPSMGGPPERVTAEARAVARRTANLLLKFHDHVRDVLGERFELPDLERDGVVLPLLVVRKEPIFEALRALAGPLACDGRTAFYDGSSGHVAQLLPALAHSPRSVLKCAEGRLQNAEDQRLLHRVTHQLLQAWFPDSEIESLWLREGLADLFSAVEVAESDNEQLDGPILHLRVRLDGVGFARRMRRDFQGQKWPLDELLPLTNDGEMIEQSAEILGGRGDLAANLFAFQSWALAHFSWFHDEPRYRRAFLDVLAAELAGEGGPDAFRQAYDADSDAGWDRLVDEVDWYYNELLRRVPGKGPDNRWRTPDTHPPTRDD